MRTGRAGGVEGITGRQRDVWSQETGRREGVGLGSGQAGQDGEAKQAELQRGFRAGSGAWGWVTGRQARMGLG